MIIVLAQGNDVPLYEQVMSEIKVKILSGELQPGDALPSIRQLAADLLISVITTKRAYQELEAAGFVETRPGKGTFVCAVSHASAVDRRQSEIRGRLEETVHTALRIGLAPDLLLELFAEVLEEEVTRK